MTDLPQNVTGVGDAGGPGGMSGAAGVEVVGEEARPAERSVEGITATDQWA